MASLKSLSFLKCIPPPPQIKVTLVTVIKYLIKLENTFKLFETEE